MSIVESGPLWSRASGRALIVGTITALLAGCGIPIPTEVPDTNVPRDGARDGGASTDRLVAVDDGSQMLITRLAAIDVLLRDIESLLLDVAGPAAEGDTDAVRAVGAAAVARMLGPAGGGEGPGLVPAIEPDRSGAGSDDLITALVTAAGDVGGERSRLILELVRDPMLGDLGAWQRDPVGVIAVLRTAVATSTDAGALDAVLLELSGELTRALGYALAVTATDDPVLASHAARQAAGRIGVVLVAVELATETLEGPA